MANTGYIGVGPADRDPTVTDDSVTTAKIQDAAVTAAKFATTGTASSTTFLRGDMSWQANAGGDVTGPGSSTDDALAKYDSTTGKVLQNSNATLSDAGVLTATTFVGNLTGNASGTAATVTGATQSNITALGTIASLVATTADINGGTFDGIVGGTTPAAVTATQVDITAQGDLRLQDTTGGEYVAIQAPAAVTSWTLTLPTDDGTASQFLQTDGAGVSTWATVITDTSGAWTSGTSTTGKALVMGF